MRDKLSLAFSSPIYLETVEVGNKNAPASDCNKSKGKCYGDPADGYNNGSNKSSSWGKIHLSPSSLKVPDYNFLDF